MFHSSTLTLEPLLRTTVPSLKNTNPPGQDPRERGKRSWCLSSEVRDDRIVRFPIVHLTEKKAPEDPVLSICEVGRIIQ